MKSNANYTPIGNYALLLVGEPKTGKSTVAMGFPDPYFLLLSDSITYGVRRYPNKRFWYDVVEQDDDGNNVPERNRWKRAQELVREAWSKPEIKTIVIDTLNRYADYLCIELVNDPVQATKALVIGGQKCMTQNHWYPFGNLMKKFVSDLRATGKLIVCTCHRKIDKDEMTGALFYKPALGGHSADTLGGLFTDIWCCEARPCQPDAAHPTGVAYIVRTAPAPRMNRGTVLKLPAEFEFNWSIVEKLLNFTPKGIIDK